MVLPCPWRPAEPSTTMRTVHCPTSKHSRSRAWPRRRPAPTWPTPRPERATATPTTRGRKRSPAPPSKAGPLRHFVVSDSLRFVIPNASRSAQGARSWPQCCGIRTDPEDLVVADRSSETVLDLCEQESLAFLPWAPTQDTERVVWVIVCPVHRRQWRKAVLVRRGPATVTGE